MNDEVIAIMTPAESERDTHTSAPVLNIYQRRNLAKKIVREASFSKVKGEGIKYKYLPVDQIKPVVESAWNESGIVMDILFEDVIDVREPTEKVSQYTGEKSIWYHRRMELGIALVNIDNPTDRYQCVITGEAKSNSDKTWGMLYTAALKNFYKIEYNIAERKDDDDAHQEEVMIEQVSDKGAWRKQPPSDDRFFSKATPMAEPAKTETPVEVPKGAMTAADAVTLDRPIEQIRQSLGMMMGDISLSEIINPARQAWGSVTKWTDDQCRQIYLRCVKAKRAETEVDA